MNYEVFSTGGGFYVSCAYDGEYVYVVDSDCPEYITCYNDDDEFNMDTMVFSYGINEDGLEQYRELYDVLLENLIQYIKK